MAKKLFITRDELLAKGALYVPPEWRKSLSAGTPDDPKLKNKGPMLFGDKDVVPTHPSAQAEETEESEETEEYDEYDDEELEEDE